MPTDTEFKIAICDDKERERNQIKTTARNALDDARIPFYITEYNNGNSLLHDILRGDRFDVLLLDVVMDGLDGMNLARELRKQKNNATIIFVSGNKDFAIYGYEVSAVRYLTKPLEEDKMKEAILYAYEMWHAKKEILLPGNTGEHRISFSDIQFVEAYDRGTKFFLDEEIIESQLKFNEAEKILPKSAFLLCHRSFLVNLKKIKSIHRYEFLLKDGKIVPISKKRYQDVYKQFIKYIND